MQYAAGTSRPIVDTDFAVDADFSLSEEATIKSMRKTLELRR
jgi:hypothetical protein